MENEVGAKIVNGEIIVIDGLNEENITVKARKNINLFINDIECELYKAYEVTSKDKINCNLEKTQANRKVNINVSEDKMKAFITVEYTPELEYKLKDKEAFLNLAISTEILSKSEPEHFTIDEIKKILKDNGVVHGIDEEALIMALDGLEKEVLIAEGKESVNDIPSEVKLFFTPSQMTFPEPDSDERVDYKNLFKISNVNAGDKIAEIIPEVPGEDGINVLGQVVKREYIRSMPVNASEGCKTEENNIIALIDGKAHMTNRNISVNPVYSVESVNMKTCNIKFYGDIEVYDSIEDNMVVNAGGSVDVIQNVNTANVIAGGKVTILGNALNSQILSGQTDLRIKEYSDVLIEFRNNITQMIEYINELRIRRMQSEDVHLIRTLTEGNFSNFQKIALNIISLNIKNKTKRSKLMDYIKDNILGLNISNMKSEKDLLNLNEILENEIDYYDKNITVPLDIRVSYCQDCEIKATGNIIIGGQGEYISKLTAMKDILFSKSDSVARGGILSAGGNVSAEIIGSEASIATTVMVPLHGRITAALAYKNTIFCFGKRKIILEENLENINAYYDADSGNIEFGRSAL